MNSSSRMPWLLLGLQLLILLLLAPLAVQQLTSLAERAEARQQIRAMEETAGQLEATARFAAAEATWRRASRLALAQGLAEQTEQAEEQAERARALVLVSAPGLPERSRLPELRALQARLDGGPAPSPEVAAALEVTLLRAEGLPGAGTARVRRALDERQDSVWLRWQHGQLLQDQGSPAEAAAELEQVLRDQPAFAPAERRLALARAALGKEEQALRLMQQAVEHGAAAEASLELARLLLAAQQWAEAIPHLEGLLRTQGEQSEVLRLLASAQFRLEHFEQAAATYRKAHRLQPDPRTLFSAAVALHAGKKLRPALELLAGLTPHAGKIPEVLFERAMILAELGQPEDARPEFLAYLRVAAGRKGEERRVALARQWLERTPATAPRGSRAPVRP